VVLVAYSIPAEDREECPVEVVVPSLPGLVAADLRESFRGLR